MSVEDVQYTNLVRSARCFGATPGSFSTGFTEYDRGVLDSGSGQSERDAGLRDEIDGCAEFAGPDFVLPYWS